MNDELPVLNAIGEKLVAAISGQGHGQGRGASGGPRALRPVLVVGATAVVLAAAVVALLLVGSGSDSGRKVAVHAPLVPASGTGSATTLAGGVATDSNGPTTTIAASGGTTPGGSGSSVTRPSVTTAPLTVPPTTFVITPPRSIVIGLPPTSVTTAAPNIAGAVNLGVPNNGQTISVAVGSTINVVLPTTQVSYNEPVSTDAGVVEQIGGAKSTSQATGQFKAVAAGSAQVFSSGGVACTPTAKVACPDVLAEFAWRVTINVT